MFDDSGIYAGYFAPLLFFFYVEVFFVRYSSRLKERRGFGKREVGGDFAGARQGCVSN